MELIRNRALIRNYQEVYKIEFEEKLHTQE